MMSTKSYEKRVSQALDKASQVRCHEETRELGSLKMIIFSDHHRGQLDGADDFKPSRSAYHAALAYYLSRGYELVLLGDVEELWECTADAVISAYKKTLELEQQFAQKGRLYRFVGNHDDHWLAEEAVANQLGRYLGQPVGRPPVLESMRLNITSEGKMIGRFFLTHGHQGSGLSDRHSKWSRKLVRYIWRPLQRLSRVRVVPTPARSYSLRRKHELSLFRWAERQNRTVLVTGHTHLPIFPTLLHERHLERRIENLTQQMEPAQGGPDPSRLEELTARRAALSAQLEWTRAEALEAHTPRQSKPCYFNSGCCCYPTGEVTGIEISAGEIRLVRWPDRVKRPLPWEVYGADLRTVFDHCSGSTEHRHNTRKESDLRAPSH